MCRKILGKEHTGQKIYKCFWLNRFLSFQIREPEKTGDVLRTVYVSSTRLAEEKTIKRAETPCVSPVDRYSLIKSVIINIYIHIHQRLRASFL